jgi:hypothetical protein
MTLINNARGKTVPRGRAAFITLLLFSSVLFGSCFGAEASIAIRRDGSGTIDLEYRVAQALESLGKLDGNERWPPVPAGRADFERSAARVAGLSLASFSSSRTERDVVYQVRLNFETLEALASFLDAYGSRAVLSREGERNVLTLRIGEGNGDTLDKDLLALASSAFEGYRLFLRFSLPASASSRFLDTAGAVKDSPSAGEMELRGTEASYAAVFPEILSAREPVVWEIAW